MTEQQLRNQKLISLVENAGGIKNLDKTWEQLGAEFGMSGEAARSVYKRRYNSTTPTHTSTNEELFEEFLEWKRGHLVSVGDEPNKKEFNAVGAHLVLGCMHVPFHNKKMLDNILRMISENEFVGFHLIGDFLDLNTMSFHDNNKFPTIRGLTLDVEYKEGNKVLDEFESVLSPYSEKSFIYGNHEDRHNRYMANMQASKTPLSSPKEALRLRERGFAVHDSWSQDSVLLGEHLELIHGTYYNVHCAKKHMDVLRGSVMFAHTHRIQTYIEGNTGSFNIGCCIDLKSPAFNYAARATKAQWQNGFAVVYVDKQGDYFVQQIIVQNGKFIYNGQQYF